MSDAGQNPLSCKDISDNKFISNIIAKSVGINVTVVQHVPLCAGGQCVTILYHHTVELSYDEMLKDCNFERM